MRCRTVVVSILVAVAATSGAARSQVSEGQQRAIERILAGGGEAKGEAACDVLRSGPLLEVFGAEAEAATYQAGSKYIPHFLCSTYWDKPNREVLDAAAAQYEMNKALAKVKREAFDQPKPPPSQYRVSLTIVDEKFASPEAAVASLESTVSMLSEGLSVEVDGKEHIVQTEFAGWVDGVGDRAIWTPKASELLVAHAGVRFAVAVSGFDEAAENKAKAIELAQRVAAGI
jgi:hypothetical protein